MQPIEFPVDIDKNRFLPLKRHTYIKTTESRGRRKRARLIRAKIQSSRVLLGAPGRDKAKVVILLWLPNGV